ncbi:MAG: hypothetical protein EP343_34250 [Deltaproteobacteria bacterium]|nr:MAG: hypothetical protein EP343_34250 [Deltaproteobacteria bacterium]
MRSASPFFWMFFILFLVVSAGWVSCSGGVSLEENPVLQERLVEQVRSEPQGSTESLDASEGLETKQEPASETILPDTSPERNVVAEEVFEEPVEEASPTEAPGEALPEQPGESTSPTLYRLVVNNGYGGGQYRPGTTAHVWAGFNPYQQLVVGWKGGDGLLKEGKEWHTTLVMPSRDVTLDPIFVKAEGQLQSLSFQGTTYKKPVLALVPSAPKGVILAFHGTGGSNTYLQKLETLYVARVAYQRGYAVVSTDAEEVQAGDLDKNGYIRWHPNIKQANNPDIVDLKKLVPALVNQKVLPQGLPLFALGMSNGGAMAVSVGEALKMKAVVSYCASGRKDVVAVTQTPTMWLMCGKDTNPNVDNSLAQQHYQTLLGRKVPTVYQDNSPSPLYAGRFFRILGVNLPTSTSIAKEIQANKLVDSQGFFSVNSDAFAKHVQGNKSLYPTLTGLSEALQLSVLSQVKIMMADHQMFDDFAGKTVDFFDKYR